MKKTFFCQHGLVTELDGNIMTVYHREDLNKKEHTLKLRSAYHINLSSPLYGGFCQKCLLELLVTNGYYNVIKNLEKEF